MPDDPAQDDTGDLTRNDAESLAREETAGAFAPPLRGLTIGLLASVGIVAFDGLGVTTALPRIAGELDGFGTYGWAVSALMLASVIGTVVGGVIADRRGPRAPYVAGSAILVAGLVLSATAQTWPLFLLGRVVQGLGVGAVMSMAYVLVAVAYPRALQARALALLSGAWTVPALAGPLVSGALAEAASWRFLFVGLTPLVLVAGALTLRGMPSPAPDGRGRAGLAGQLVFSAGLAISAAVLLAGLEQRDPAPFIGMVVGGGALMILALRRVVPGGTLSARRGVPAGIATRGALAMAFFGVETFLPLAMTELRGAGLVVSGLGVAVGALVWVAGSLLQSRHERRRGVGTRRTDALIGLVVLAAGIVVIAVTLLTDVLPVAVAIAGWLVGGLGMGLAYNATTAATFGEAEPEETGRMSGTIQMAQTLGTAVVAGVGTALISWERDGDGLRLAMGAIFALTALLALAAIPLALRISREGARAASSARLRAGRRPSRPSPSPTRGSDR